MPIAAVILARAIRDPKDLAHARLPSSVAPAAPFICGSCPSHPVTVLGNTEQTACVYHPYARTQPSGSFPIRSLSIHSGPHITRPLTAIRC
jgi:hypothetical protein